MTKKTWIEIAGIYALSDALLYTIRFAQTGEWHRLAVAVTGAVVFLLALTCWFAERSR